MNIFKLLLKNAIRVIKKTKILTIQLCVIVLLATTVITSVFISNRTLRNSYDNIKKEGNIADFSLQNSPLESSASFLISKTGEAKEQYNNINFNYQYSWSDVKTPRSNTDNMIYTPYKESLIPIYNDNFQKISDKTVYGYYNEYNNPTAPQDHWPGIVYSKTGYPISLNTDLTSSKYKGRIKNVFSFYKNVISPTQEDVQKDKTYLYNLSNYATNPWSFKLNDDGSLGYSEFGLASIDGFHNANTFSYNQGMVYSDWGLLVGTDKIADKSITTQQIVDFQKEIAVNENLFAVLATPSSPLGITKPSTLEEYLFFQRGQLAPNHSLWNYYSNEFFNDILGFSNNFKNKFLIQSPGYIELNYKVDEQHSNNKVKFIVSLYNNKRLPTIDDQSTQSSNPLDTELPKSIEPYLFSKIRVPLIPYINLKPLNDKFDVNNPNTWKGNSELDNDKIPNLFFEIFNQLSKTIIKNCERLYDYFEKNPSKYGHLIREYKENYDFKEMLRKKGVNFSVTNNITTNNISGDNYIISSTSYRNYNDLNPINSLVIKDGSNLFDEEFDENRIKELVPKYLHAFNVVLQQDYDPFNIPMELLSIFRILKESYYYDSDSNSKEFYETIEYLMTPPENTPAGISKYNQAKQTLSKIYYLTALDYNGYGLNIRFKKETIPGVSIQVDGVYTDKTSLLGVVSENFKKIKTGEKAIVPKEILTQALKLPYTQRKISLNEVNNNINKYRDNFILNLKTNKVEFYNDFLTWFSSLESKYKLDTSGGEVIIIGTGINPEFIYPILNKGELIINNNNPVVFGNSALFKKLSNYIKADIQSNIWGKFNSSNIFTNISTLKSINKWTQNLYHKDLAYQISDPLQPNNLLYTRINFPVQIMNTVFSLTITLAAIISILSLFFIATLLRSIIKQNLNIIAISIANGISKTKIALSFFSFALIPGIFSSLLALGLSQFVYPIINSAISDYWILQWDSTYFNAGLFFLLPLLVFGVLFLILLIVIFITVRKNLTTLLTSHVEFRMNKLISWTKPLMGLLSPIASFRLSYVMGNITRFIVLLLMMTFFIVTASTYVSTISVFDTAIKQTLKNRKYNYAIDLLSPTKQGGYYYDIPKEKIGSASQGLVPNVKFPTPIEQGGTGGVYDINYKPYFTYKDPLAPDDTNKQLLYNSLFTISADLVSEIHGNPQFFRNRILTRNTIDVNVNFLGNNINPWFLAQQTLPSNITSIADKYYNETTTTAFQYYLFLDRQTEAKYNFEKALKMWLIDESINSTLLDDVSNPITKEIYTDPKLWKQDNWIYKYVLDNTTNKYKWVLNPTMSLTGLPTFELKKRVVQLWVNILSFNQNPNFIEFNKTRKLFNENFYLALNIVPFDQQLNETYSYINTTSSFKNKKDKVNINIIGIKPTSNFVYLYNEYEDNKDMKDVLREWEDTHPNLELTSSDKGYPIIVNEVVSKKYNLHIGDTIDATILNTFDRFIRKFNNLPPETIKFVVSGITTSKSDERIYTSQLIANKLLKYTKPELATADDIKKGNYDNKWLNQEDIDKYIPFNGVFTKEEETPIILRNFATMYSLSGLSPIAGGLPKSWDNTDATLQLLANWEKINQILKIDIINLSESKNPTTFLKFLNNYKNLFETETYMDLGIVNLDAIQVNKTLGLKIDNTTGSIMLIIIVSFLPTLLIIVSLLALMVVIESRRLISLLKVLGYGNLSNAFSLTTSYFILLFLSLLIGVGITQLILYSFSSLIFLFFNIIINPTLIPWIFATTFGVLLLFVIVIWLGTYFSIKKTNVPQVISVR